VQPDEADGRARDLAFLRAVWQLPQSLYDETLALAETQVEWEGEEEAEPQRVALFLPTITDSVPSLSLPRHLIHTLPRHHFFPKSLSFSLSSRPTIILLASPTLRYLSPSLSLSLEECRSLPSLLTAIWRPAEIALDAFAVPEREGKRERVQIRAGGLAAHLLCHEVDHLDGILHVDLAALPPRQRRDIAMPPRTSTSHPLHLPASRSVQLATELAPDFASLQHLDGAAQEAAGGTDAVRLPRLAHRDNFQHLLPLTRPDLAAEHSYLHIEVIEEDQEEDQEEGVEGVAEVRRNR